METNLPIASLILCILVKMFLLQPAIFDRLYQRPIHHLLRKTIIALLRSLSFAVRTIIDIDILIGTIPRKLVIEPIAQSALFLPSLVTVALLRAIIPISALLLGFYVPSSNHYSLIIASKN